MSTFTNIRVGKKPYFAGSPKLVAAVSGATAAVVGTLPPGAIVLSAVGDDAGIEATIGDGTTTVTVAATVAGTPEDFTPELIAGAGDITITSAVADSTLYIEYILQDARNGDNA